MDALIYFSVFKEANIRNYSNVKFRTHNHTEEKINGY